MTIEDDDILLSHFREWGCMIHLFKYGVNCLGAEWSRDHTDYPHHSLLCVEYVDQCVTLTPSSFVSPEQAPLVRGVEKINMEREEP